MVNHLSAPVVHDGTFHSVGGPHTGRWVWHRSVYALDTRNGLVYASWTVGPATRLTDK
jgi:hypothetical protein